MADLEHIPARTAWAMVLLGVRDRKYRKAAGELLRTARMLELGAIEIPANAEADERWDLLRIGERGSSMDVAEWAIKAEVWLTLRTLFEVPLELQPSWAAVRRAEVV